MASFPARSCSRESRLFSFPRNALALPIDSSISRLTSSETSLLGRFSTIHRTLSAFERSAASNCF
ncbi:MAG: hypothetical protein ABII00_09090 [Elusimicrobiota bacterium]